MRKISLLLSFLCLAALVSCSQEKNAKTASINESHPNSEWTYSIDSRTPVVSAHRGGKEIDGFPENHLSTIKYLHEMFPEMTFEIDINASSDGVLYLFHDNVLDHKTTGNGPVSNRRWNELSLLQLKDHRGTITEYSFNVLEEVLEWADNENVTLWLDMKRSVDYEDVIKVVRNEDAGDNVILISYTMGQARKLHSLAPNIHLSISARNLEEWNRVLKSGIDLSKVIAFTGTILSDKALFAKIHEKNVKTILGTLGNLDRQAKRRGDELYKKWFESGIDIFSTDRPVELGNYVKNNMD